MELQFSLLSKCGKIARAYEKSKNTDGTLKMVLEEFPDGPDTFLIAAKLCFDPTRISFT